MKGIYYSISLSLIFFFNSCKEELTKSNQYKGTPLVTALLDPSEEYHYIKVNRAYIGPGDSFEIAKITDSIYYSDVIGTVTETNTSGTVLRTWVLRDTVLQTKEPGVFASPEVRLKYFKTSVLTNVGLIPTIDPTITNLNYPLKPVESISYKLDLNIENGKYKVSGTTQLVRGLKVESPSQFAAIGTYIQGTGYVNPSIKYREGTGFVHDVRLSILVHEYKSNGDTIKNRFEMKVNEAAANLTAPDETTVSINGQAFYESIKNNLTIDNSIVKRRLLNVDFSITGASQDFANYISITKPTTSLSQNKPIYTNLICKDVNNSDAKIVGIFSARTELKIIRPIWYTNGSGSVSEGLTTQSVKELCTGPLLSFALFKSNNPTHSAESWFSL